MSSISHHIMAWSCQRLLADHRGIRDSLSMLMTRREHLTIRLGRSSIPWLQSLTWRCRAGRKFSLLQHIAKHGVHYTTRVPHAQGVHLQHSQTHQLCDPVSRDQFFHLLCRLIFYLSSGRSHVPFPWNHAHNAINMVCPRCASAHD
jgi:hypothetical protein